jgi:hypothetical protein
MDPEEFNITDINIHSFNNKSDKGDDDFETWMQTEAPFEPTYTINIGDYTTETVDVNSLTMNSTTITGIDNTRYETKKIRDLKYSMPLDVLYKWFPEELKNDFDDEIPF